MCLLHAAIAREQQLLRRCAGCAYGPSAGDAACMRVLLRGGGRCAMLTSSMWFVAKFIICEVTHVCV